RFPQGKFDMVRVGLVLYGIDMTGVLANQLEPVGQLKTSISQIKTLEKGASVGYNRKAKADKKLRVATIAIGYADGYRRAFGNKKAHVLVRDKKAAVIGNVCMDMCMIDVTHIPEAIEGDEVLLFGKELPVEILAKWADTIPYEILTGIGERVKRVYFKE
ncbi:MAG: alanine racemase C-terminal domain-containing protein, partial [Chitinophagales bacterium]